MTLDNLVQMSTILKESLAGGFYLAGIVAALSSYFLYRRNSTRERMKWLFDLYKRFYNEEKFQDMSTKIEAGDTKFIEQDQKEPLQNLDQYLNFFEFVGILWKQKEIELDEIKDMFDYPLRQIAKSSSVLDYVREYGY